MKAPNKKKYEAIKIKHDSKAFDRLNAAANAIRDSILNRKKKDFIPLQDLLFGDFRFSPYVDFMSHQNCRCTFTSNAEENIQNEFRAWADRYAPNDFQGYHMDEICIDDPIPESSFMYETFDPIRPYNWDKIWEELSTPMKMKCFKFFYELDNAQIIRL